jgi:oligopeptide transport system substrate-binding protein
LIESPKYLFFKEISPNNQNKFLKRRHNQILQKTESKKRQINFMNWRRIMKSHRMLTIVGLIVVLAMVLGACQKAPAAPSETIRINMGTFPDLIDPQKSSFVNEIATLQNIYEGLTRLDTKLETVAGSAEKWVYNADATEITFTLRKNLKYSDGTVLNAKRFEYSLFRLIDPLVAGDYGGTIDKVVGAVAYRSADPALDAAGKQALKDAVGIKALDSKGNPCTDYEQKDCNTLKLTMTQPTPYMHTLMYMWVAYPAKQELIEAGGETWWLTAANHLGNGPFKLVGLEQGTSMTYEPNAFYWRGVPKYNLDMRYITDSAVSFEAYKNNEFDIIPLAAEDLATVEADATLSKEYYKYAGSCTYAFFFTSFQKPFTDKKVREAFAYGTDREAWVKDVLKGLGKPTLSWIPEGWPGYDATETRWGYDPAAAKAAIAASSYGSIDKLDPVVLTFGDTPRNRTRFEWLANMWKQSLGVDVALNPTEPTTYTALTKDKATMPQTFYLGWCADYPDPQNWLSLYWMSSSPYASKYGYSNPAMDAVMNQADVEMDPAKRLQLYIDAQKLLTDDVVLAYVSNSVNSYMIKPWVKGVVTTANDAGWPGQMDPLTITIQK